ncbi:PREDICTED: mitogen-activated protein kinase kinase kinase 1-like [Tarenaya hassleriana]|uniref:mitogen-activated protein kinase kinase kinase 1-like n=1 Tax=Tarenaya hassleriana TaxID=28532 RepID=UPI00053C19F6|nr:PREDICTED: mitogen-activated protein kinase kinase kinase 1-like [Tarenaya hassleriana]
MEIIKLLGKGSFGSVNLVKFTDAGGDSVYTAMKTSSREDAESLFKEFGILSKFRGCPRIVQCYGDSLMQAETEEGHQEFRMFMEYASGGTLIDLMCTRFNGDLPHQLIKEITRMILEGLVFIHGHGYVHCDLKPTNILVFPREGNGTCRTTYEIKISDFGLSREAMKEDNEWSWYFPFIGTPSYMSPESVCEGRIGTELDLWSLGCIVLQMFTGELPWSASQRHYLRSFLASGHAPIVPETVPCDAREFIETCLARNPEERSSAAMLLEHPFLRQGEKKTGENIVGCAHRMPPPGFDVIPTRNQRICSLISKTDEDSKLVLRSLELLAISMLNGDLSS